MRKYNFSRKVGNDTFIVEGCDSFDEAVKSVEQGIYRHELAVKQREEEAAKKEETPEPAAPEAPKEPEAPTTPTEGAQIGSDPAAPGGDTQVPPANDEGNNTGSAPAGPAA